MNRLITAEADRAAEDPQGAKVTGSIGTQAADVIATDPERYEVVAIGAARSVDTLAAQAHALRPKLVAIADRSRAAKDLGNPVREGEHISIAGARSN